MKPKFLISWLVAFIVWMALDYAVHGVWLAPAYMALGALYRPEADQMNYMPYLLGGHVLWAAALVALYQGGVSAAGWMGQGIRFGLRAALLVTATYLIYYAVQPMPRRLVAYQIIGEGVTIVLVSLAVAFLNKAPAKA